MKLAVNFAHGGLSICHFYNSAAFKIIFLMYKRDRFKIKYIYYTALDGMTIKSY